MPPSVVEVLHTLLTSSLPPTGVSSIVGALGITSSVVSFVLTTILSRPAMVRWRPWAWSTLAALWGSVAICLLDFLYPAAIAGVCNLGLKLGILVWVSGVVSLLFLVNNIFFDSFVRRPRAWRLLPSEQLRPFREVRAPVFGVPFIDDGIIPQRGAARLAFPILLIAERGAHGLGVALRFVTEGLKADGVVWLAFTRPCGIVYRQIAEAVAAHEPALAGGPASWADRLVIIDGYSRLYLERRDRELDTARIPDGVSIRHCDPRDPLSVKDALQEALRSLQQRPVSQARVVYDSLSDFVSVADREWVLPYLRWSIVWEERYCVQSIYLIWPEVLEKPVTSEYLAWFGNSVLRLSVRGTRYTAELEGVGSAQIAVDYNGQLELLRRADSGAAEGLGERIAQILSSMRSLFR